MICLSNAIVISIVCPIDMEIRFAIRLVPISLYKDASSNDPYGTVVKNFPLPGMLQLEPNW